ncbi:hypothetical protein [Streptomyces sp. NPDC002057]|uniref:hypothetical protein n=1 Tax=Streptomyces sp. NPDC002057 TaxID=3154664 RepID=UPI003327C84F
MLIELVKVAGSPGTCVLASVRTSFGQATVRWCGSPTAEPGAYHVEWTIDEAVTWGRNAQPAAGIGPGLRSDGRDVVLRGQLNVTEDGAALLELGGTQILLDLADRLPSGAAGGWVELFIEGEKAALYPYEL